MIKSKRINNSGREIGLVVNTGKPLVNHVFCPNKSVKLYREAGSGMFNRGTTFMAATYIRWFIVTLLLVINVSSLSGKQPGYTDLSSCKATLIDDVFTLDNGFIKRCYRWNRGDLSSLSLQDKEHRITWSMPGKGPDMLLPGCGTALSGTFNVEEKQQTAVSPAYLQITVNTVFNSLEVKRVFRLYPDCAAIACVVYLKGTITGHWADKVIETGDLRNIEGAAAALEGRSDAAVMEKVSLPGAHWRMKTVEFFDITDRRNNLVSETAQLSYRSESKLRGNLLMASDLLNNNGVFILKEAPCSSVQLAYPGFDFLVKAGEIKVCGMGVEQDDVNKQNWTRCYGFVTGVTGPGEYNVLKAVRNYQQHIRRQLPGRDHMIMMNTWGDRNQDKSVNEKFIMNELSAASQLGVTHFQIDDGWQVGKSASSAFGGSLKKIWDNPDYWKVDPAKFPNGLKPIVDMGRRLHIEICLWFNPSSDDGYAHWKNDAETLIGLYKQYGIRTFKIDGILAGVKKADENLRKMFDTVQNATAKQAVFNLDVTSGRRFGYHYFNEYGNVFLENRYTDWANYYPHWTLRNLWMLSRYVPAQNLQIEFLNNSRNKDKYPVNDPLAPAKIPFEYEFAITMMAQPLAWMEATGLPRSLFSIAPVIKKYQSVQEKIHQGMIFPIGNEPDGFSWTGFQSDGGTTGYLLVFREANPHQTSCISTYLPAGSKVKMTCVLGKGANMIAKVNNNGGIKITLPGINSYALYHYQLFK